MGGFNSGSVRRSFRDRDSDCQRISVKQLNPWLRPRTAAGGPPSFLTLVSQPGEVTRLSFAEIPNYPYGFGDPAMKIDLTTTRPNYGGWKFWFVCPRATCRRRCSVLYRERATNVRAFACRRCIRMRYESQVLGKADIVASRIARPLLRLLKPDGTWGRPRYMHKKTYARLSQQIAPLWRQLELAEALHRNLEDIERHVHLSNARQLARFKREATRRQRAEAAG